MEWHFFKDAIDSSLAWVKDEGVEKRERGVTPDTLETVVTNGRDWSVRLSEGM